MAWVDVSCPRPTCGLNLRLNGIKACVCGALLVYRPSPRRRVLEFKGRQAYRWYDDQDGTERVTEITATGTQDKRGRWLPLPGDRLEFAAKIDGRRTSQPPGVRYDRGEMRILPCVTEWAE